MHLKNKINLLIYIFGTCINILMFNYWVRDINLMTGFVLCVVINHWLLIQFGSNLLGLTNESSKFSAVAGIIKFFVLILAFVYVVQNSSENIVFIVGSYIFQLIILVISIKTIVEKT